MRRAFILAALGGVMALAAAPFAQDAPIVIKAGTLIDGRGGVRTNVTIVVQGGKIRSIGPSTQVPQYDYSNVTVIPGMIDTHVHIDTHFGPDGRAVEASGARDDLLAAADNAREMLMNGFTATQSIGAPVDLQLRSSINQEALPGPRFFTSIQPVDETTGTPEQIRAFVRNIAGDGADLVKVFASKSVREGGAQTLSDEQIAAACGEARALGKRTWVHAHADSAARAASMGGCTVVAHASQVTDATLQLMAQRGTYLEPNIGLVSQNYMEHKAQYLGSGNFDEAGFKFTEDSIPLKLGMFKRAMRVKGLKILMGTDAGAGAHGQNARETIYRVRAAGWAPMDAIVSTTSMNAESMGMKNQIGALAPGMDADIIVVDGDPLEDITALRRVVFVMKAGRIYKSVPARTRPAAP